MAAKPPVNIPNDWTPMRHQWPFLEALDSGDKKRAVLVWHRRAGKDSSSLNFTAVQAFKRVGVYWHMLPTATQARKVVWDGIDRQGRRVIDQVWPQGVRVGMNNQEMKIELQNGSLWQCVGSDNFDSLVGSNPIGVVFSEYSIANPAAWNFIRPILAENGGWAIFIYTPRGKGAGYQLYQMARDNPDWFCERLSVDDTDVISTEMVQAEREAGMSEALIQQEFYSSFDIPVEGAYYANEINAAYASGRVGTFPIEPILPVYTFWDLGIGDSTAIWLIQATGKEIRLVATYANNNEGMAHYINWLKDFSKLHNIRYGKHYAPHDIEVRELMSGKSRKETARTMGIIFQTVKRHSVEDGIESVRRLFPRFHINEPLCEDGLAAISSYCKEYDEKNMVWRNKAKHDWTSHYADSLRQLGMAWRDSFAKGSNAPTAPHVAPADFQIF